MSRFAARRLVILIGAPALAMLTLYGVMQVTKADPQKERAREAAVLTHIQQGRHAEAHAALLEMRKEFPRSPFVPLTLGRLAVQANDAAAATREFRRVTELAPEEPEGWYRLGLGLGQSQQYDGAREAFTRALQLAPNDPEILTGLGFCELSSGSPERALPWLQKALNVDPNHPEANLYFAEALYVSPERQPQLSEAQDALRRAVQSTPGFAPAWFWLGRVYLRLGEPRDAVAALRQAVEADPQDEGALQLLGQTLLRSGQAAEGRAVLARFRKLGAFKTEIDHLQKQAQVEPQNAELQFRMARLLRDMQLWQPAVQAYEQGLRLDPQNEEARRERSALLQRIEETRRASPVPVR